MTPNLIDGHDHDALIDRELASAPPVLSPWFAGLRRFLRRHLPSTDHMTIAQTDAGDPAWAKVRAAQGARLHRLGRRGLRHAALELGLLIDDLAEIAAVACDIGHPLCHEAAALLRALPHARHPAGGGKAPILGQITNFPRRARIAHLKARRHAPICAPGTICTGALTGTRCTSIDAVLNLGREAGNCLAVPMRRHLQIAAGGEEIWALRAAETLVAILAIRPDPRRVVEVLGLGNDVGVSGHGRDLVRWCQAADVLVSRHCRIRLAELLPPHMALPEALEDPDHDDDEWVWLGEG